ncbi:MAG: HDOD domain-containing protein [Gammaproteobacteria bacterium]|nr:HDOD domain-containing protein [Gammaproteobacteria bacterium]
MKQSIEDWIKQFGDIPIPVMQHTIDKLTKLCAQDVPVQDLVELIETDPGLTVQLIRTCSTSMHGSLRTEVTSVQQALMIIGIEKLKTLPTTIPTIEKKLSGAAKEHLLKIFSVAYHAARQSTVWANMRRDMVPDEVTAATLLHFIGAMLMSIHAPELLDDIRDMRDREHIATEEAQYIVLGFTIDELSLEIAQRWNLPSLLLETLRAENARHPRAYTIMLAVQLARHSAWNWYTPKMQKLYEDSSEWLDQPKSIIIRETHKLAVDVARDSEFYNVNHTAALLLADYMEEVESTQTHESDEPNEKSQVGICLVPQLIELKNIVNELKSLPADTHKLKIVINLVLRGIHDGAGLNRAVFTIYDKPKNRLKAYSIMGADNDPVFGQFQISLIQKNLFSLMSTKVQAVWVSDENREKFGPLIPEQLDKIIRTNNFYCMSALLRNELFGLFYADKHTTDCQLDKNSYKYFKAVCMQGIQAIERLKKLQP